MPESYERKSYEAKVIRFSASGLQFTIASTLEGSIDFAIKPLEENSLTYVLTRDDARKICVSLGMVISDIDKNCLFENDPLLVG